jgi:hypothetical protein
VLEEQQSQQQQQHKAGSEPAAPPATSASGIYLRAHTATGQGAASERLVLRSSDGRPRVQLTPEEAKAASVTREDIEAVRQLS